MKFKYELVLAVGVFVLGLSTYAIVGQSASRKCSSEECACEKALKENTVEALESFLRKYPHAERGTSACAAIAVPPPDGDSGSGGQTPSDGVTVQPGAVPSE